MQNVFYKYLNSPVGWLKITTNSGSVLSISFTKTSGKNSELQPEVLQNACIQLEEYFAGKRKVFDIPLAPLGTDFQKEVWKKVTEVPYGEKNSYGFIAEQIGSSKKARAVGLANAKNPIPIIIPCHRIVGNKGELTGYAGGLEIKRRLLLHEAVFYTAPGLLF